MQIIRLTEENTEKAAYTAAEALAQGGIIIYPTDTIYGFGVNALDPEALVRLRHLKVREQKKPVSILVPTIGHIERYGELSSEARAIAERHLPGALTLVLPATKHAPKEVLLNDAVGIRVPGDTFSRALGAAFGGPITSTSANRAGIPTPRDIQSMIEHFGPDIEHVSVIIDGGECSGGVSSTVISFAHGDTPRILREGAIPRSELGC
ncbi:MAG: L-threonylcarbamoyladenylate synthase [Patescibacteria group bacterium]